MKIKLPMKMKHQQQSAIHECLSTFLVVFIAVLTSGCGLSKEQIQIGYSPITTASRISGAATVGVDVQVKDFRSKKNEVGKKGDEYEFLAPILAENDVAEVLGEAIKGELETRGFDIRGKDVLVQVELSKFYNRFRANTAEAELFMHVQVRGSSGDLRFSVAVHGIGVKYGASIRSGENAKFALDEALQDAVHKLLINSEFIEALVVDGN